MAFSESYADGGIVVIRSALDVNTVRQFERECAALTENPGPRAGRKRDRGGNNPFDIYSYTYSTEDLAPLGAEAAHEIAVLLKRSSGYNATINHQSPGTRGDFHDDSRAEPGMLVVQASDFGYFDFAIDAVDEAEAIKKAKSIPVQSGDIVVQLDPGILHRGRNPSNQPRRNMVLWKPAAALTLAQVLDLYPEFA